jgi:hypothetical protein
MHERTPIAEFKRIFGAAYEAESRAALIGMELEAVQYGYNVLLDVKPGESPLRPEGEAAMKKRAAEYQSTNVCHGEYGWPVAGLLAEPMKIVQARKETMILYEVDNIHRQVFTDGRQFPATFEFPAYFGYSVGRWDGDTFVVDTRGFKRPDADRCHGASPQRSHARNGALTPARFRASGLRGDFSTILSCTPGSSVCGFPTSWSRTTISSRCSAGRMRRTAYTW